MRILLSSVGRRGYLVKFFREALAEKDEIWGGDGSRYAPAFAYCDKRIILPKVNEPSYIDHLIQLCQKNKIDMIVPLIDPELKVLAAQRDRFFDADIMVVVSPLQTVQIAFDKYLTYQFGKENDIPVPYTVITVEEANELLAKGIIKWPLVVKPRQGSASKNITCCHNEKQLENAFQSCPMPMIQEWMQGKEYGYDIFGDRDYRVISVYCKLKLAMRAGETDKAVSKNDKQLIALGVKIAENLQIFGPIDVDVMVGENGPKLLEINPRFGGGYPCSHFCGADFPRKLIAICQNETLKPDIDSCPAGVYMLKQDEIISPDLQDFEAIEDWHEKA
ncbi:MAG: ATP-grasp domain-containing protein [Sedimentisphaerales bacterium]|nr:ATP-grasp domain-containing protein [Sedimentisphaerales bacterium]